MRGGKSSRQGRKSSDPISVLSNIDLPSFKAMSSIEKFGLRLSME